MRTGGYDLRQPQSETMQQEVIIMSATADDRRNVRDQQALARAKGYEHEEACGECGNFTLVRDGKRLQCDTCGTVRHDGPARTDNSFVIVRTDEAKEKVGDGRHPILSASDALGQH